MPPRKKSAPAKRPKHGARHPVTDEVQSVLTWLKRHGAKRARDEMGPRYGIRLPNPEKAFGVRMSAMQKLAKGIGKNHELALALWETGWYEARIVAAMVDDPARVSPSQMDRWCRDFDNWGICDTVCFHLFDRNPHAWAKVAQWSDKQGEFIKRAAFALLACLALHDDLTDDEPFARFLPLIERAASDERNFVKKGVSWALRAVGRRSPALNAAAVAVARRLSASPEAAPRWVGKDALRDLTGPAVTRRLAARRRATDG